ncbi:MAG: tripartite tricarboxylate transporter substrate binding protein [Betaproteobacteria bacterium]|nr:tripartite tricarboxylate transporter substrate binding protein [Betaproteobacteria bacterium]
MFRFPAWIFALCASLAAASALAQTGAAGYPSKPVRLIYGFPAGGPADMFSRTIAAKLTGIMRQQIVVDSRPGAGGILATEIVARAPADGYTVYLASSAVLALHPSLYSKLPYDLTRDFAPVTLAVAVPELLAVHPSLPTKTARAFAALAKANPKQLLYGSTGNGNMPHLAMESFKIAARVDILHVPYKGAAPAVADLLGGHVQATILDIPVLLPHVKAGKMRALALATAKRSPVLPDVPTMAEAGYPAVNADNWYGVIVAAATPKDIVSKLHGALVAALQAPETKQRLEPLGANALSSSPQELAEYMRSETAKWGKIIRTAGIKLDAQ